MSGFDEFWAAYPRRKEKFRARTAYDKALKHGTHEEIMAGVRKYAAERRGKDQQYIKHPATWLNAGCWMDYEPTGGGEPVATNIAPLKCPKCWQWMNRCECVRLPKTATIGG